MNEPAVQVQARNAQTSGQPAAPAAPSLSVSDAARLMSQRRSELRQQQAPTEPQAQRQPAPEMDAEAQESSEEEFAGSVESGDAFAEDQPQDGSELLDDDAILSLDGEEIAIKDIRSWREGAMRADDYQRKTQAAAQTQQAMTAMEQELNRFAHGMNRVYESQVSAVVNQVKEFGKVDWGKLAESNPNQYNSMKAKFEVARSRMEATQGQWQSFLKEYEDLSHRAIDMKAKAALPQIKQRIRGWNDGMYAERASFLIESYGADKGVVGKVTDPWFWELANDAYNYRKGRGLPDRAQKIVRRSAAQTPRAGGVAKVTGQQKAITVAEQNLRTASRESDKQNAAVELLRARRLTRR